MAVLVGSTVQVRQTFQPKSIYIELTQTEYLYGSVVDVRWLMSLCRNHPAPVPLFQFLHVWIRSLDLDLPHIYSQINIKSKKNKNRSRSISSN